MLPPGLRPQALPSLCFCILVLACVVGEEERMGGCGAPAGVWGVGRAGWPTRGYGAWVFRRGEMGVRFWENVSVVAACEVCSWGWCK